MTRCASDGTYGKASLHLEQRIAVGDHQCRVTVWLMPPGEDREAFVHHLWFVRLPGVRSTTRVSRGVVAARASGRDVWRFRTGGSR